MVLILENQNIKMIGVDLHSVKFFTNCVSCHVAMVVRVNIFSTHIKFQGRVYRTVWHTGKIP